MTFYNTSDLGKYILLCDNEEDQLDTAHIIQQITLFENTIEPGHYETWPQIIIDYDNKTIYACNRHFQSFIPRINTKELFVLDVYDFL